jgi:DNA-binding MarR family transcriptional regulator
MNKTEIKEYIFGSILLLANKIQIWGDKILEDLTLKQWFLLMLISKMGKTNPTINEVSEFTGTSRQNVKKMLEQLKEKKYVKIIKSKTDARALNVSLLKKTYEYFTKNEEKCTIAINDLFSDITDDELSFTVKTFDKLHVFLETQR